MRPRHVDEAFGLPAAGHPLPLLDILDLLGFWRSNGKIEITSPAESYSLHVDRGRILAASSSLRTLRLGHLLLQRGAVEPVFLHDVLYGHRTVPVGRALGATLLKEGAVTRTDLAATVEEQIIEILARAIAIQDSTVLMIADDPLPTGIEPPEFDTTALLEEANARHARRAAVRAMQRLLPRPDVQLELTVQLPLVSYKLADPELLVALQVDKGAMTLDRLSSALPLDPFALKRAVINLLERGYLAAVS
jgi:hypothetical protein